MRTHVPPLTRPALPGTGPTGARAGALAGALAGTLAGALALSSCSAAPRDAATADETLRVVGPFEVHSLEPAASDGVFTRLEVAETLVSSDLSGELTPGLATDWSASPDHRSWTFQLPAGATFHDGSPVTAEAVADSLERAAADEASPLAEAAVERVVAAGGAVRFETARPSVTLPALLTHYSAAVLAPASYDGDRVTEVVGTGPYAIDSVELPASVETSRFDGWRGETPPAVEKVSFQAVGRAESRALLAVSDQADVVFGLEPAGRERVEAADGLTLESSLQPRTILLKVDHEHPLLGDLRVRRALSLAIDRPAMAGAVLREEDLAATQLFPPSLTAWHSPGLAPLEHDVARARELLTEAGFAPDADGVMRRDGAPLELTLTTYPDRPELPALATAIQQSAREAGFLLDVEVANSSEIPAGHADGSLEIGLMARHFALVADPLVTVADTFDADGSDWGVMNWSDDRVLDAVDDLLRDEPEPRARADRATVSRVAQEELPLIPVAWYRMNAAVNDRVADFVIDPLERTWRISELEWSA